MTVREVLEAARESVIQIRKLEELIVIRRELLGPQGHTYDFHSKNGVRDPMRAVDEFMVWESELTDVSELRNPIREAVEVVDGIESIGDMTAVDVVSHYYINGESWNEVAKSVGKSIDSIANLDKAARIECLQQALKVKFIEWDNIGIAQLRELGRERQREQREAQEHAGEVLEAPQQQDTQDD